MDRNATARVIGDPWSRKSHDLKDYLARYRVGYEWTDLESPQGREAVQSLDAGDRAAPLLVLEDGRVLADPSEQEVAEALGLVDRRASPFYDLVIVGGGPAGLAAAVNGASEGLRTLIVEESAPGGQAGMSASIENYLGFPDGLTGGDLARRSVEQAQRFGTEILAAHAATDLRVDHAYRVVTLADGTELYAYAVLLATGVDYRMLDAPGSEPLTGKGVYYGAASAEAAACRQEDVYVLGGGNSAGQAAVLLARYARRVTVVTDEESLETTMSEYLVDRLRRTGNVHVRTRATVSEARGTGHLEQITLHDTESGAEETITSSRLFVFIGATPRTEWLPDTLQRDADGFLRAGDGVSGRPVNASGPIDRPALPLESSIEGVFVAGDVRADSVKRVTAAVGDGASAIQSIHEYLRMK